MHKQKSFPLRIGDQDRRRAQRLAQRMGLSENRLYSDLIQEGLLVRRLPSARRWPAAISSRTRRVASIQMWE